MAYSVAASAPPVPQGSNGQFTPFGKQAPHVPAQQYSPALHDFIPQDTTSSCASAPFPFVFRRCLRFPSGPREAPSTTCRSSYTPRRSQSMPPKIQFAS